MKKSAIALVFLCTALSANPPRLTIVVVVDQLSYHFFKRAAPFFTGAFKELLQNGIVYEQANFPHGMPSTSTGHAALSTGTYAHNHGIIGNYWYDLDGTTKRKSYNDKNEDAALFVHGTAKPDRGISAKDMLVDGLSDQYMMTSNNQDRAVYSFSLKSRAAIGMGDHQGKAIWWDTKTGQMSSSKAFFEQLPSWLDRFNQKHPIEEHDVPSWPLMYSATSKPYRFDHARDDRFCSFQVQIQKGAVVLTPKPREQKPEKPHKWFSVTPAANQYVLDCAYTGIRHELPRYKQMLVWISVSSIDKLGHAVGPYNIALFDMLYQLDKQLKNFMHSIKKLLKRKESVTYVLTADHGVMPLPQLLAMDHYPAKRLDSNAIITDLNEHIKTTCGIESLVKKYKSPQFFLDELTLRALPQEQQSCILKEIINRLKATPGIKNAWTFEELRDKTYPDHSFEEHFKMQLYPGRSGRITIQTQPYILMTDYTEGTGHKTPYNYDTQVPFILYRPRMLEKKHIATRVWTTQLAPTLAHILEIPRPSASMFSILPGVI